MSPQDPGIDLGIGYEPEYVGVGAYTDNYTADGCAKFQGSSISDFSCENDSMLHLSGNGESYGGLMFQADSQLRSLEKLWECTITIFWLVTGGLCFSLVDFSDFGNLFKLNLLGICIVAMWVIVWEELAHIGKCMRSFACGRRIRPIPPFAEIRQAFLCQCVGIACNYMILEFDVEIKHVEGVEEINFGIELLILLCRYQELVFLVLGLLSFWSWRLDEITKYPGRASRADRRITHRKRPLSTRRSFVALFLLCNLLCCESVAIANRICVGNISGPAEGHDMTDVQYPFRPYEDIAAVGDPSRPEGCGDVFEEPDLEGSSGQHEASIGLRFSEGCRHAPGDCRANLAPIDIPDIGAMQSFVPGFGETMMTKRLAPVYGDHTVGENTATPNFLVKDDWAAVSLCEEGNDYATLMQRLPLEQQRVPFALASERGLSIRRALELSRRLFTPIWMREGRDVAFEYFRSTEQGIWQKKVLGWKFLSYEQEIGLPFSTQLLPRGLWATQLIGPFEDDNMTPQPTMMHHVDHHRGLHDVVTIALEPEAYASDRLPLMIQYDLEGIIVQTAVRCPIACTPIMICELLQLDERCQSPFEVRVSYRDDYVERIFVKFDRVGLPAGSFIYLHTYVNEEQCESELPQQYPLREHQVLVVQSETNDNGHDETEGGGEVHSGLPHEQEYDAIDFMQDPDIQRMQLRMAEEKDEDTSLMQVGLPAHDLVTRYMENVEVQYDAIEVAVWYHPLVLMGQKATFVRWANFMIGFPGGPFVRGIWSRALGRGPCYVYPVRPMPEQGGRAGPQFIVTNFEGENVLPTLMTYRGDGGSSRTFTYIFEVRQWPTMMEIFDAVIPDHGCVWDSDCVLIVGPFDDERAYTWNMRVMLYEGAYLRLYETPRDGIQYVMQEDGGSTCDGTATHSDSVSDSEGSDVTSSSSSPRSRAAVEGDDSNVDYDQVEGETGGSPLWMMQLAWELDMAKDEEDFLAGAEEVHMAAMEEAGYSDLMYLDGHLQEEGDVVRNFLQQIRPCEGLKVFTVHLWLLEHEIAAIARIVPLFHDKSMTQAVLRELGYPSNAQPFWVTVAKPMPPPLSLRVCPIDLVALTSQQRSELLRVYLIDVLFRGLPKRVAVAHRRNERLLDIVRKCGLTEACTPAKYRCILSKSDDKGTRKWGLLDEVDEVHGSSFELEFLSPEREQECEQDVTSMMQMLTTDLVATPSQRIQAYIDAWAIPGNEVTLWLHNDQDSRVQAHPMIVEVSADRALLDGLGSDLAGITEEVFPVTPPPIFLSHPRPHVIFVRGGRQGLFPILCQLFLDRGQDLKSVLVESGTNVIDLKKIFDLASPGHGCGQWQHCYARSADAHLSFLGTIHVQASVFIRLYLVDRQDDGDSTCCCTDGRPSLTAESAWSDDDDATSFDRFLLQGETHKRDGENTATPQESLLAHHHHTLPSTLSSDGTNGDNTATPAVGGSHDAQVETGYDEFSIFQGVLHLTTRWTPLLDDTPRTRSLRQIVRDHMQLWHEIHRTERYTRFHQFSFLLEEATAFRRGRGHWQEIVICGMIHHVLGYWELALEDDFSFTLQEFQNRLRAFVTPPLHIEEHVIMAGVKPMPTVFEQQGDDGLYVLIGHDVLESERLVLVALWDLRTDAKAELHPMTLPQTMLRDVLLQSLGLERRCMLAFIDCVVLHDSIELPHFMPWRTFHGMKITVEIRIRSCMAHVAGLGRQLRQDEEDEDMTSDEMALMQMDTEVSISRTTRDDGLSSLSLLEHRVRLQRDLIYRILAEYREPDGMKPVSGLAVSFWLLKGELPGTQKSEKRIFLHTVVPDWTQWVEQDWMDKALVCNFILVKQYVTSNGPERSDHHVLGTSAQDREKGFQTILVDLTYDNIRSRGAVRYPILATVAEIVVLFVGGPVQVQHGILAELELHWRGEGGVYVFKAMETPAIPNGAFVHIVKKGRRLPDLCSSEQFHFDEDGEIVLMQREISLHNTRELRNINDPLYRLLWGWRSGRGSARSSDAVEEPTMQRVTLWRLVGSTSQALFDAEQFTLHSDCDSWSTMADPLWVNDGQYVFSLVQPLPDSSVPQMMHVFETPLLREWKYALVDLLLRHQHIRAAVAYGPSDTALDIYRIIAYGRYRLQRLLSTSLYMSWKAPENTFYYLADQVPRLPDGAYVVMRIGELPEQACVGVGGMFLLQQRAVKMKSIEPLERKGTWRRHPVAGLRPPGNPVQWLNIHLERMDDCFSLWNTDVVVDFPLLQFEAAIVETTPRLRTIRLHEHIGGSGWQTKPQGPELRDPGAGTLVNKCGGQEQCGTAVISDPKGIDFPDFAPLLHAIYVDLPRGGQMNFDFEGLRDYMEESIWNELKRIPYKWMAQVERMEIYTDGSMGDSEVCAASWAFLVFGYWQGEKFIIALDYGLCPTDPMEEGWYGAVKSNARNGEIGAQLRAIEWLFAYASSVEITIHYDAMAVGEAAAGRMKIPQDDRPMRILRSMVLAFATWLDCKTALQWKHVKSHVGNFGNECADAIAKLAYKKQSDFLDCKRPDYGPYTIGAKLSLDHFWLVFTPFSQQTDMPGWAEGKLCPSEPQLTAVRDRIPACLVDTLHPKVEAKERPVHIRMVTYNVSTLGSQTTQVKVQYLREQLEAHGCDVAMLQETRARRSQMVQSGTHIRVTAAAKDGQGGTEIWLLRTHPKTGLTLFEAKTVQVYYEDPEMLLLQASFQGTPLLLRSAHAPHTGRDVEQIRDFWERFKNLVRKYQRGSIQFLCGIDANAHFTDEFLPHIGPWGLEQRSNVGAEYFLEFIQDRELLVPSTFADLHDGDTVTWRSPANGQKARCDYILVPLSWAKGRLQTYPLVTLDSGAAGEDHVPLGGDFHVYLSVYRQKRARGFDRIALQKDLNVDMARHFAEPPVIDWQVDVDVHAAKLTTWISDQLCQYYPKQGVQRKKSYISDTTWGIRMQRIQEKKDQLALKQQLNDYTLSVAWQTWKTKIGHQACLRRPSFWASLFRVQAIRKHCAELSRDLSKALKKDRVSMLEQVAGCQHEMTQHEFIQKLKTIGVHSRRKPSAIKPLPIVSDEHGHPLFDYQDVAERWRQHFGEQEAGEVVQLSELFARDGVPSLERLQPTWEDLPTLPQIEHFFRTTKKGKAFFIDSIPGDLLSGAATELARAFYPLYLKQVVQLREAILYKGGRLVPSYKKGPPGDCTSYRSLFVSSPIGKALHAAYRPELVKAFKNRLPLQIGGMPGFATVQATMCISLYHRFWLKQRHSVALLFVDIASAFYRLVREHFIQYGEHASTLQIIFRRLGLPDSAWLEFQQQMHLTPAIEQTEASPFMRALFKEFYCRTWFIVNECPRVTQTYRGSRPGDSLADLCFAFALSKILQGFESEVLQKYPDLATDWDCRRSPFPSLDRRFGLSLVMPVWADDIALAIHAPTPGDLNVRVGTVTGVLFDRLASAGLQPNLKAGKTEIPVDYKGNGTLQARRDLLLAGNVLPTTSVHVPRPVRAVPAYKHLGTWIRVGSKAMLDLRVRFGCAHTTVTHFKTQIFGNKGLDFMTKINFLRSLVFSAMHFNAAGWVLQSRRERDCLHKGHFKLLKRVAMLHFGQTALKWETGRVYGELGVQTAEEFLREARLRFCIQLVHHGTPHLWALLQHEQAWIALLQGDFEWLRELVPETELPPLTAASWEAISAYIAASKGRWQAVIRKAVYRHISDSKRRYQWDQWHKDILREFHDQGLRFADKKVNDLGYFCAKCKLRFATQAAQTVHAFKKHGRLCEVRHFVSGTQCEACLRQYSSHVNLINHAKRKEECRLFYLSRGHRVVIQAGVNSRGAAGKLTEWSNPFMQAQGPRNCEERSTISLIHPQQAEFDDLSAAWTRGVRDAIDTNTDVLEGLRVATGRTVLLPKEVLEHFEQWLLDWNSDEEDVSLETLQRISRFRYHFCAEWIIDGESGIAAQSECAADIFHREAESLLPLSGPACQMPIFDVHVVAHLFSGHRRPEDLQSVLELKGFKTISIDIIFDKTKGNLLRKETFSFFRRALYAGWLKGFVAGPPCETWSKARANAVEGERCPRVVRTASRPFGKKDLTRREHNQVDLGSGLLGVALHLVSISICCGAVAILEHPEQDEQNCHAASIWRLPVVRMMHRFANCTSARLLQGHYGGKTPKPTRLLFVNATDELETLIVQGRCTALPKRTAVGRKCDGSWATTELKEYPGGLCRLLAEIIECSLPPTGQAAVPREFDDFVTNLVADFDLHASQGRDYNPATGLNL